MRFWLLLTLLAGTSAQAADWSPPKPYLAPVLGLGAVSVNGNTWVQANGGAVAGVRTRYQDSPHWLWHTRGLAVGTLGINSGSLGADLRVGSFIGPDFKLIQVQVGPDVFYNGYGRADANDYQLTWAPGLDWFNQVLLKLSKPVQVVGQVTPGWVFEPTRQSDQVAPFHQLDMMAAALIRTPAIRLTLGVRRTYNQAGVIDAIVLGGAL